MRRPYTETPKLPARKPTGMFSSKGKQKMDGGPKKYAAAQRAAVDIAGPVRKMPVKRDNRIRGA